MILSFSCFTIFAKISVYIKLMKSTYSCTDFEIEAIDYNPFQNSKVAGKFRDYLEHAIENEEMKLHDLLFSQRRHGKVRCNEVKAAEYKEKIEQQRKIIEKLDERYRRTCEYRSKLIEQEYKENERKKKEIIGINDEHATKAEEIEQNTKIDNEYMKIKKAAERIAKKAAAYPKEKAILDFNLELYAEECKLYQKECEKMNENVKEEVERYEILNKRWNDLQEIMTKLRAEYYDLYLPADEEDIE